jgi:hypothetical protein
MHTRIGYPGEMLDPDIEAAARVLLLIPARSDPQKY